MSEINLKRFVDIDIKAKVSRAGTGTRDTVVLFTPDGESGTITEINSLAEALETYTAEDAPTTRAYLSVYYNNGGIKCRVVEGIGYSALTAETIKNLDNDYIIVACAVPDTAVEQGYAALKTIATTRNADSSIYGINEKIIIARTEVNSDASEVANFAVKYSNELGAEMTIAAYLCQINVYKQDTVHDYAFTAEAIDAEAVDDTAFGLATANDMNIDIRLAGAVRNMGGNCKDGADLTNNYVRIILHQTLTDRLISLLAQKIKNTHGISQIYSAIAQELEEYRNNGYLTTDKIWTADNLDIVYNQQTYRIIDKGTALVAGYYIKVLPLSSLTDADKAARKAPPIYVIIADQYGIRQITISGEVI